MIRKLLAFIAYNLYSICFVWAFQVNTAYQFDSKMISRLTDTGFDVGPSQWGWGNHYLWRLIAAIVATSLAGFLTGAIARKNSGGIAALSNIPSIGIWAIMIYIFAFSTTPTIYGDQQITSHTGMLIISILAIPVTTLLAYAAGKFGAETQLNEFDDSTILGIKGYHWIWFVIPIYFYSVVSIKPIIELIEFDFIGTGESLIGGIINILLLIIAFISVGPIVWVYLRLKKPAISASIAVKNLFINTCILIIGYAVVAFAQYGGHWLLVKVSS